MTVTRITWIISCIHSAHDKIAINLSINQLFVKPYYVQILKAIIDYKQYYTTLSISVGLV